MVWNGKWTGMEISVWDMEDARKEWNGTEDFKNGMEDNLPYFHVNSYKILHVAFTDKYIRVVTIKNMWQRLAANHLGQINWVIRL